MNIQLKKVDDSDYPYLDEEGTSHSSYTMYVQCEMLKMCGCGQPEDNVKYILAALELVAEERNDWHEWNERCKDLFKTDEAEYFMWYWLETQGLTEHGSSVPGWLTEKGKNLLADLKEIKILEWEDVEP